MLLERLVIYYLRTPLTRPYELSFGVVHQFDTFVALAQYDDGSFRAGESTPLPGYSHETAEQMSQAYLQLSRDRCLDSFLQQHQENPFIVAPLLTCLDTAFTQSVAGSVALCPILQWKNLDEIPEQTAVLAQQGNSILKVKIGSDLRTTQEIIRRTQRAGEQCNIRFRYDANQCLTDDDADRIVRWLDHPATELLEQPFPVDAWQAMANLHAWSPIPLMLDESIVHADHVARAASCADLIKVKLAKNGSPSRLLELIQQARQLGLKVILGNGVQGPIGCWLEGQVQIQAGLELAGEMNGYRKIRQDVLGFLLTDSVTGFEPRARIDWAEVESLLGDCCEQKFSIPLTQRARVA